MGFADGQDEWKNAWPANRPPGRWLLSPEGAEQWARAGIGSSWPVLQAGRGPGRFDAVAARWWPEDFGFDPFDVTIPPFGPLRRLFAGTEGWPAFSGDAGLRVMEAHPIGAVPAGASRFASGGWPARVVAFDPAQGALWWWDPAGRQWCDLRGVGPDRNGQVFGCDDGVALLANGRLAWIMADHVTGALEVRCEPLGQALAAPVVVAGHMVWPATLDGELIFWQLRLPVRTDDLADAARYKAVPGRIAIEGMAAGQPPARFGNGVRQGSGSAWFLAAEGAIVLRGVADNGLAARWHAHPDGFRGLCDLALHRRRDTGALVAHLENADHVATMALGEPDSLRVEPGGLSATLGGQRWIGRRAIVDDDESSTTVVTGDAGTWLLPVAEVPDGVLMLEFQDVTRRDARLRGTAPGGEWADLLLVNGGIPRALQSRFRLKSVHGLAICAHETGLLIVNREDSRQCCVLGFP